MFLIYDKLEAVNYGPMKKILILLALGAVVTGGYLLYQKHANAVEAREIPEEPAEPEVSVTHERYTIDDGDTFTSAAEELGIGYQEALRIVDAASEVFDFTKIKLGREIRVVFEDGVRKRLEYEPDAEQIISVDLENGYETTQRSIEYDVAVEAASVMIKDSLYLSGLEAGVPETVILEFAEVFAWEVDFATQVQAGDSFEVLYEKRIRNGEEAGYGDVLAGRFTNSGEVSEAFRFTDPEGRAAYYDSTGNSLVRPFLKAPLSYSRITSGYTNARFHPITGTTSPHRAIDYAAPTGTPIMAVGDGTVVHAAYSGGFGNFIKIRHNGTYQTHYAHLSRYAVTAGDSVKQGDVIGYVGSTGWSTGPHLHYEIEVNGSLVNPLEVEFPKGDPLSEDRMQDFLKEKEILENMLQ